MGAVAGGAPSGGSSTASSGHVRFPQVGQAILLPIELNLSNCRYCCCFQESQATCKKASQSSKQCRAMVVQSHHGSLQTTEFVLAALVRNRPKNCVRLRPCNQNLHVVVQRIHGLRWFGVQNQPRGHDLLYNLPRDNCMNFCGSATDTQNSAPQGYRMCVKDLRSLPAMGVYDVGDCLPAQRLAAAHPQPNASCGQS